jgi:hypothetical protein
MSLPRWGPGAGPRSSYHHRMVHPGYRALYLRAKRRYLLSKGRRGLTAGFSGNLSHLTQLLSNAGAEVPTPSAEEDVLPDVSMPTTFPAEEPGGAPPAAYVAPP